MWKLVNYRHWHHGKDKQLLNLCEAKQLFRRRTTFSEYSFGWCLSHEHHAHSPELDDTFKLRKDSLQVLQLLQWQSPTFSWKEASLCINSLLLKQWKLTLLALFSGTSLTLVYSLNVPTSSPSCHPAMMPALTHPCPVTFQNALPSTTSTSLTHMHSVTFEHTLTLQWGLPLTHMHPVTIHHSFPLLTLKWCAPLSPSLSIFFESSVSFLQYLGSTSSLSSFLVLLVLETAFLSRRAFL